jgi:2-C-methyl-D-erythritol 4-phosphate cytidylyltransferase/2-C-methyl-D-erythritol 2,4-cyclodiphosphate synthase
MSGSKPFSAPLFCAVVVAAGRGSRTGLPLPKQFAPWRGKPVLRHSVETLVQAGALPIVVAIPEGTETIAAQCLDGLPGIELVTGGGTRQESVARALEHLAARQPDRVLIHDAARPALPPDVIARLLDALDSYPAAIPVLPVVDSLAVAGNDLMTGGAKREELRRVQTPQAFHFTDILAAHRQWHGDGDAGDDAQVAHAASLAIALVDGDERLRKLTFQEDFMQARPIMRVGTGFDVHRLAEGEDLWLAGLKLDHSRGLAGHSDADVAIHAVVDALLGAIGEGDIGSHFPPSDPQWRGAASGQFLTHATKLVRNAGYAISNCDLTIICEAPKIGPHRDAMRQRLAELMGLDLAQVGLKATTTEKLGFTGRGEGIAAQAVVCLLREE